MSQFFDPNLMSKPKPKTYNDVKHLLDEFCNDVQKVTNGQITCALKPGFITGVGQEWKVITHSVHKGFDYILFLAHVPSDGVPVRLYFGELIVECATVDEVRQALLSFAQTPETEETIRMLLS